MIGLIREPSEFYRLSLFWWASLRLDRKISMKIFAFDSRDFENRKNIKRKCNIRTKLVSSQSIHGSGMEIAYRSRLYNTERFEVELCCHSR